MTFYLHLKIQNINANAISLTFSRWPWLNNVILKDLNTKHILTMQYDVRDTFPEYLICKFEKITDALVPTYTFYLPLYEGLLIFLLHSLYIRTYCLNLPSTYQLVLLQYQANTVPWIQNQWVLYETHDFLLYNDSHIA